MKILYISTAIRTAKIGFTVTELLVVVLLFGLGISLGFTTLLSISRRERLRIAVAEAAGFLESVRQSAIAHSINCLIDVSSTGVISSYEYPESRISNRCTPRLENNASTVDLRKIANDFNLTTSASALDSEEKPGFSLKGTAIISNNFEIRISASSTGTVSQCITITSPLGFIRTGKREGSTSNCLYTG